MVHTQWTETRAIWNKGQHAVRERVAEVEMALPFAILGFDSDNGGEFLNWHLADYFLNRPEPVAFTCSRPSRKNDNARVEQKNWTHVRQLVGYVRLADPRHAELLNDLYAREWGQFRNFFCPVMKHLRTEVEGSRKKRVYDQPMTPFEMPIFLPADHPRDATENRTHPTPRNISGTGSSSNPAAPYPRYSGSAPGYAPAAGTSH